MTTVLSADGHIAIPRELREKLGFSAGQPLELRAQGDLLVAWKQAEADPFEKWRGRGSLPAGMNIDDYLRLIRDGHSS